MYRRVFTTTLVLACAVAAVFGGAEPESADTTDGERLDISIAKVALPHEEGAVVLEELEELYDVNLEFINIERDNSADMLALRIATGEIPDMFWVVGNMVQFKQFYDQGVLRGIPIEMLRERAPHVYALQEPYLKYVTFNGEVYGLTGERLNNMYPLNAIWRWDWLENVGITSIPVTLEEAEAAFYAFAHEDPDGNGRRDTYGLGKSGLDMVFGAFGGIPWGPWEQYWLWQETEDGELVYSAVQPGMKDALALLRKWYADGVLDPEWVVGENKGGYWAIPTDFVNNRIGFTGLAHFYHWAPPSVSSSATGGAAYTEFKALNPDGEVAYGGAVVGPYGDAGTWLYPMAVGAAEMVCFSHELGDEELIRCLEILDDMLENDEHRLLTEYGFEETHWERSDRGAVQRIGDFTDRVNYHRVGIQLFPILNDADNTKSDNPALFNWADEYYGFPGYLNKLIVGLPSEPQLRPDLDRMRDEYYVDIISGTKPLDAFDEFVEQWFQFGGETLTAEANAWYSSLGQ